MIPEDIQLYIDQAEEEMKEAIEFLRRQFKNIRAGKATPSLLDGLKVEYYGAQTPLNQVANISAPEARLLVIQPWEKSMIKPIEKAIQASNLDLNPQNDGTLIRIALPMLTAERRDNLVKVARETTEEARISVRNARRDANDGVKKEVKKNSLPEDSRFEAEDEVQKLTDTYIAKADALLKDKEEEITSI